MKTRDKGRYARTVAGGEAVAAFVPYPLPPANPPLALEGKLELRLQAAEKALDRLELAGEMVPSVDSLVYAFIRREAVLSSQIAGNRATLVDLFTFEARDDDSPGVEPSVDVEDVCNYLDALSFSRAQLADPPGLPLSMHLLNEAHQRLMRGVGSDAMATGEVRRTQSWIDGSRPGNAVYVPPPPELLDDMLGAFEGYLHADDALPPLVRVALLHAQFAIIHPYVDGNGRMGRLLATLLLGYWKRLTKPLLCLSLFFKRHPAEYDRRLTAVRVDGDWEGWVDFCLDGVQTIADETVASLRELVALVATDRARLLAQDGVSVFALRLFELLPRHPTVSVAAAMRLVSATKPTAGRAIEQLVFANILVETTGKRRDRYFVYKGYLDRLRVGTELDRAARGRGRR